MTPKQIIALGAFGWILSFSILGSLWGWPAIIIGVVLAFSTAALCIAAEELHR